jgi:hypothetical protein
LIERFKEQGSHIIIESHNPVTSCFREMDTLAGFHRILPEGSCLSVLSPFRSYSFFLQKIMTTR